VKAFVKALLLTLSVAAIISAGAAYLWTAKRTVVAQRRDYAARNMPIAEHGFALLEYRFRPILVWRASATDGRIAQSQYTFGAWKIEKLVRTEWCGNGSGVLVEAIAQYDYGESHDARLFYDFGKALFLTTLDHRTTEQAVDKALQGCEAH